MRGAINALPITITEIASSLKLSVGDMAKLFGVSRQSVHNWKVGSAISYEHQRSVDQLLKVAKQFGAVGIIPPRGAFARQLQSGLSFMDAFRSGVNVDAATVELITVLKAENDERDALTRQLERRNRGQTDGRRFTDFEA